MTDAVTAVAEPLPEKIRTYLFDPAMASVWAAIRSILFITSQVRRFCAAICRAMACTASVAPFWASTSSTVMSASAAPLHAALTMARSSLRFGAKMPGVSTSRIWLAPRMRMPRTRNRVVCAFGLTMDSFAPVSRFSSVDLPAFGAPTMAANPQREVGTVSLMPSIFQAGQRRHPARPSACCRRCPPQYDPRPSR